MKNRFARGFACLLVLVTVLAMAATPAHARLTPAGAGVSWAARNVQVVFPSGMTIRCPTADYTGTIDAAGMSMSVVARYSRGGGITCTTNLGASAPDFRLPPWTFRSVSSIALTSATGDVALDAGSESINLAVFGCDITISGPQTIRTAWSFSQATQTLTVTARAIRATGSGGICGTSTTANITGDYMLVSGRITIS